MRKIMVLTGCATAVLAGVAFAGLNPEFPNLPTAQYPSGTNRVNNQGSAMCVDCHSRLPQAQGGTHFVSADLSGDTHSSGGWAAGAGRRATLRSTTEAGQFFAYRTTNGGAGNYWSSGGFSKYFNGTNSVIVPGAAADYGDGNAVTQLANPVPNAGVDYFTSIAGGADPAAYDLICESCHNIIINVAGGNNLLEVPSLAADWGQDSASAPLCVGCHGFMYSANFTGNSFAAVAASASTVALPARGQADAAALTAANTTNDNWTDYRNFTNNGHTVRRGNNEDHYILGSLMDMNHHVMTGDDISVALMQYGYGWRDVFSLSADAIRTTANDATAGQYPVNGAWTDRKVKSGTAANMNCLNCHANGHGSRANQLQAPASTGASILLDTTAALGVPAATSRIARFGELGRTTWMTINDNAYCGNCHHLPGASANSL